MRTKKLRGRGWFAAASTLGLLLTASPAIAQEEWTPRTQGNRLGADVDFLSTYDKTLFNVSFIGQVRLTHHIYLDFDLPWGYSSDRFNAPGGGRTSDGRFVLGNPTLGVHYAKTLGRHVAFFVGGLLTIPTHFRGSNDTNAAFEQVSTRAYDDFYRFLPEYVDLTGRIGVEITARPLFLRFDARPVFLLPVGDANRAEFIVQQSNELELLANMGLGGGVRLQAVFFPTIQGNALFNQNDRAQLAFEPFFAYEPAHHGFFARVGVLIAADEPLGFGFDHDKVATVRATLGGKW